MRVAPSPASCMPGDDWAYADFLVLLLAIWMADVVGMSDVEVGKVTSGSNHFEPAVVIFVAGQLMLFAQPRLLKC